MSHYYQSTTDVDKESSLGESSTMKRHKDVIWDRRPEFFNRQVLQERQLKVLYFISYLAIVLVAHFSKLFYLDAGLSITQVSILQSIFYLSRYYGFSTVLAMDNWRNTERRGEKKSCLRYMRFILIISVVISTFLWLLVALPFLQTFETLIGIVFMASLTISTSHGFLDMIAEDTIRYTKTKVDYAKLRFWGLLACGIGSVAIGMVVDAVSLNMIFFLFALFQSFFFLCLFCWFPDQEVDNRSQLYKSAGFCRNLCIGGGMFNVYCFIFLFGMINALPEVLMMHLKIEFDIKALFLGLLIAAVSFGEMFGYFMISICNVGPHSFYIVGTLTLVYTAVRLFLWQTFTSKYFFLLSEFIEFSLISIFWVSTLQAARTISTFRPRIQRHLQNIWHYQSLAFGVLVYGILYDYLGPKSFQISSAVTAILLLYFFLTFSCAQERSFDEHDSLLLPHDDEEAISKPDQGDEVRDYKYAGMSDKDSANKNVDSSMSE